MIKPSLKTQFIDFLQQDLAISPDAISIAFRRQEPTINQLPIVLWHYGLITIQQLDQTFDWLERKTNTNNQHNRLSLQQENKLGI